MIPTQRFYLQVAPADDRGCHLWRGVVSSNGYGRFSYTDEAGHHFAYAHRVAWEVARGPIPRGLVLDHLCRVRLCVNVAHLEPVTQRTNLERGESPSAVAMRADVCALGHPLVLRGDGRQRHCPICARDRNRETMRRLRARRL